jgi:predicted ATPase
VSDRLVVILAGPPGSGKTTAARESGLTVYDRDDPQWVSVRQFADALDKVGRDLHARAVVLATAPTSALRTQLAALVHANATYLMPALPRAELARRIHVRGRHDEQQTLAALHRWTVQHERHDGVLTFPGWPAVTGDQLDLGITS